MALPLAPIAITAVRVGTVAAVAYYIARKNRSLPSVAEEAAHDEVEEGLSYGHSRSDTGAQANVDGRLKRTIRLGATGPGVEVDLTALGRFRIKRV